MQESRIEVQLVSEKGTTKGHAETRTVPRETAVRKALIAGAGCWVLALLVIPIPIVHFFAPPLLILFGPILAFILFKINDGAVDITKGEAPCPGCGMSQQLGPKAEVWPMNFRCPSCDESITATKI